MEALKRIEELEDEVRRWKLAVYEVKDRALAAEEKVRQLTAELDRAREREAALLNAESVLDQLKLLKDDYCITIEFIEETARITLTPKADCVKAVCRIN